MNKKQLIIYLGILFALLIPVDAGLASDIAWLARSDNQVSIHDKAKLQRGAKFYMNYCSGCHSLRYLRYNRLAKDLSLTNFDGEVDTNLLSNLIFTSAKISDPLQIAMPATDARQWFGAVPPDLSLIARVRGADWIANYLKGFYADNKRRFGANNTLVPDTAMPNVLYPLAGLSELEYDEFLDDLLTFLVYVGEPAKLIRYRMGWKVLFFLGVFCLVAYFLKRFYWKKASV
ncbi:MAG: cytochrome c1 [Tatlockia sp.]|nr:cytochrome c1 [Tatlockia sp.]